MTNESSSSARRRLPSLLAKRLRGSLRWFFAEFLVVVAGILAAIALNGWYQGRADAASERDYLTFLSRDLQGTLDDLSDQAAFEQAQVNDGVMVYRALSNPPYGKSWKSDAKRMTKDSGQSEAIENMGQGAASLT